jgi:hypothetical protein
MIFVIFCKFFHKKTKYGKFLCGFGEVFVWFWGSFCVVLGKLGIPICVVLGKKKS